jgi:ABC-type Na+ efflux pump permease subunit
MSAFWAIVRRELSSVLRDRTMLIAIVIQLFIASFSSALLIGMLSLYDPDSIGTYGGLNLPLALVTPGSVAKPSDPLAGLLRDRGIKVVPFTNLDEAQTAFYSNKVRAILALPAASQPATDLTQIKLYLPRTQAAAALIQNTLQEPLKRYEIYLRQQHGLDVRYTDLKGQAPTAFEFIYSVLVPILMFFPAFVAGSMVVDSITEEVESNTLGTLLSAPVSLLGVVNSKIFASVLLAVLQAAAWLGMLNLNRISIQNPALILLLAGLIAALSAVSSACVVCFFKDRERSQFIYSLGLLFVAGLSSLLNISPVQTISRLAIGDPFVGALDVMLYAVILAGLGWVLRRAVHGLAR